MCGLGGSVNRALVHRTGAQGRNRRRGERVRIVAVGQTVSIGIRVGGIRFALGRVVDEPLISIRQTVPIRVLRSAEDVESVVPRLVRQADGRAGGGIGEPDPLGVGDAGPQEISGGENIVNQPIRSARDSERHRPTIVRRVSGNEVGDVNPIPCGAAITVHLHEAFALRGIHGQGCSLPECEALSEHVEACLVFGRCDGSQRGLRAQPSLIPGRLPLGLWPRKRKELVEDGRRGFGARQRTAQSQDPNARWNRKSSHPLGHHLTVQKES